MSRGTSNANVRGNSYDRRRRRQALIAKYSNGKTIPCHWCGKRMRLDTKYRTWEVDRLVCGHLGGRYVLANCVPSCPGCNKTRCREGCRVGGATRKKIGEATALRTVPLGVELVVAEPATPEPAPIAAPEPSSSSGPVVLNSKEKRVLSLLVEHPKLTIAEMAVVAFPGEPSARANSWVRNSLRRLRAHGLARKVSRGTYETAQQALPMQAVAS